MAELTPKSRRACLQPSALSIGQFAFAISASAIHPDAPRANSAFAIAFAAVAVAGFL